MVAQPVSRAQDTVDRDRVEVIGTGYKRGYGLHTLLKGRFHSVGIPGSRTARPHETIKTASKPKGMALLAPVACRATRLSRLRIIVYRFDETRSVLVPKPPRVRLSHDDVLLVLTRGTLFNS